MSNKNKQETLPVVQGKETFALTTGEGVGFELNPEIKQECDQADFEAFTTPRSSLPIVSLRGKDHKGENGKTDAESGKFKIADAVTKAANRTIPDIEGPLPVTILMDRDGRAFWREGNTDAPNCKSIDAVTGIGDPGGQCAVCPFGQFGEKGQAPECRAHKQLLVYDHNMKGCYVFQISRGGLKHYDNWKTFMQREGDGFPLSSFKVEIGAFFESDAEYPYFRPDFVAVGQIAIELFRELKQIRSNLDETMARTTDVAMEDGNGQSTAVGNPGNELPPGVLPI